ncbi:sugar transferase [Virgibacillus doumboii]|uniref:sugar transferase n=1 Tax=Virgibacillus doumboii TaxID=2697503 RepID=UPI0013E06C35|nr:sugar transferase [Virgibacillus doumboii]
MELRQNVRSRSASVPRFSKFFAAKRVIDITISFLLLLLLCPFLLLIFYRIMKKDGKPVFFRQARVGKDDRTFILWKFRTLTNPSKVIRALPPHPFPDTWNSGVPNRFYFNRDSYQNLTHTGRGLKKFHLDGLPQLYNVLKGDMSLVGPSPEIVEIVDYYNRYQAGRLRVKPGITGFAQVNGNSNKNHDQKIRDDLFYIKNRSIKFDMIILYRTFKRFFHDGIFPRKRLI